jgi:type IV pilus assembly protein PilC
MDWFLVSWPTLILLGVGLRMSLRLTYGARGPDPGDPVHGLLNIAVWVLIGMGALPILVGGVVSIFGWIILLMTAATLIEMVVLQRSGQRRSTCRMLSLIVERGGQLQSSTLVAGQTMRGIAGRAAQRLFSAMSTGTPLASAIAREPKALPPQALAYLASGSSRAAQAAALRELSRPDQGEMTTLWRTCVDRASYLIAVVFFMSFALTFIMIEIIPQFHNIFQEFDLDLPPMTYMLVGASQFAVDYLMLPLAVGVLVLTFVALIVAACYLGDVSLFGRMSDWILRGRRIADMLRIVALAIESEEPLDGVLIRVGKVHPSPFIRRQVSRAATEVAAGVAWPDALRNARLLNDAERGLVYTAQSAGNLSWAIRQIAARRERLLVYRFALGLQLCYPLIILLLGSLVAFYSISLFIPIVRLIQGLSS